MTPAEEDDVDSAPMRIYAGASQLTDDIVDDEHEEEDEDDEKPIDLHASPISPIKSPTAKPKKERHVEGIFTVPDVIPSRLREGTTPFCRTQTEEQVEDEWDAIKAAMTKDYKKKHRRVHQ